MSSVEVVKQDTNMTSSPNALKLTLLYHSLLDLILGLDDHPIFFAKATIMTFGASRFAAR